jgi:hypothetical protein
LLQELPVRRLHAEHPAEARGGVAASKREEAGVQDDAQNRQQVCGILRGPLKLAALHG